MISKRDDVIVVEILAAAAPAVILCHGFGTSLYHRLVSQARDFRLSRKSVDSNWEAAVQRVARLYLPLGPFNWFEYPLTRAKDAADLRAALDCRTSMFAQELGEALDTVANDYRAKFWKDDRATVTRTLNDLQVRLSPIKDTLLTGLANQLELSLGRAPFEVILVPHCHEPTGAYSHPTVIGVDRFEGNSLIEVLLHELGHVIAADSGCRRECGFGSVIAACDRLGRSKHFAIELFHLILFHAAGQLVRTVCDSSYTTLATRRGVYAKLGSKLGSHLSEEDVQNIWSLREHGGVDLEVIAEKLNDLLKQGAI